MMAFPRIRRILLVAIAAPLASAAAEPRATDAIEALTPHEARRLGAEYPGRILDLGGLRAISADDFAIPEAFLPRRQWPRTRA